MGYATSDNIDVYQRAFEEGKVAIQLEHLCEEQTPVLQKKQRELVKAHSSNSSATSTEVLKAGNPHKTLAYWQGRTTELQQLEQWLHDKNITLIGIEGIGGTGKSTLASKIYEETKGFPKRFWADVGSGDVFSDLAYQVLNYFGYPIPERESQLIEALIKCLQSGDYLFIVDNLESLLRSDGQWHSQFYEDFFKAWVECGSRSTVIVTTRERPQLRGVEWLSLRGLNIEEGTALLAQLGIKGDLEAFTKLVDGHPLLLKLVACLLKEEYPHDPNLEYLVDLGLGNLQQLLTDGQVVGQHRRETVGMALVLDASFKRLNDFQKDLLLNVSVYRGSFDTRAASALVPQQEATAIEKELKNLVKRSFLLEKLNEQRQFEFQPVVVEYLRYKAGDQTLAHQQAISYYKEVAKQPPWQAIDDVKAHLEIFYHYYQLRDYDKAFDSIWICNNFLKLQGYYTVQVELCEQMIGVWEKTSRYENQKYQSLLTTLGTAYYWLGQYQQAISIRQQSLEVARKIGDRQLEAQSLHNLGTVYNLLGQYQRAMELYQESLEIARDLRDRQHEAKSLNGLGTAYYWMGQYQQAVEFRQQSLEIAISIGDRQGVAIALSGLGAAYSLLEQFQQAIEFHSKQLEIVRELGDRQGEAIALGGLGTAYCGLKEYQQAIKYHQQHLEIAKKIGDRRGEGISLGNLGVVYYCLKQYEQSTEFYQQQLEIATKIGDHQQSAKAWFNIGLALENLNRESEAIDAYHHAYKLYHLLGIYTYMQECDRRIEQLTRAEAAPNIAPNLQRWLSHLRYSKEQLWQYIFAWFKQ
uniref:Transcriptional regulator n=1 Tax=Tolypothrix bouteillei VB521301 TaxID=1479485 RepID=A0A0C1RB69_9CYAN